MFNVLNEYYNAATKAVLTPGAEWGEDYWGFMSNTTKCLKKTYIMMHSALGTEEASLEIGAHRAEYSLEMANRYGDAISLCAIEASLKTHTFFSKDDIYKKQGVRYINALVSDREGGAIFYDYELEGVEVADGRSSMLVRGGRINEAAKQSRVNVKAVRGDTLIENKFKNYTKISLWIDVEGAQAEVLHSLSNSFARGVINSVYIEVEQKKFWQKQKMLADDIIGFMNKRNFTQFLRDNEYGTQYNIIFVNNDIKHCDFQAFFDYYRMCLQSP